MNLTLSKAQAQFLASQAPVAAMLSGVGAGKSWIGTLWADFVALKFPRSLGLIGANTPAQLNTVVVPSIRKHLDSWGVRYFIGERPPWPSRYDSHSNVLSIEGGSQVLLRSMFESGIDRGVRGLELDWAYVDEARDVEESVLDVLLGRMRGAIGPRQIRLTSTPNGKKGWLYKKFISAPHDGWLVVRGSTLGNARNLPPGYVAGLKATYSTEQYSQEVLGHWVDSMDGMVYRFDRAKHLVRKDLDPARPIYFSLDLNVSPMVGVVVQFDERRRTMHAYEEIVIRDNAQTRVACQMVADRYRHRVNECLYQCDEAGAARSTRTTESDVLIMQELMPKLFGRSRSMNGSAKPRVVDRVNAVNAMLDPADGQVRLTMDPACGELIADLETISWDQYGKIDKSDPQRTHASDALGYAVHRLFPVGAGHGLFGLDASLEAPGRPRNVQAGFPAPIGVP